MEQTRRGRGETRRQKPSLERVKVASGAKFAGSAQQIVSRHKLVDQLSKGRQIMITEEKQSLKANISDGNYRSLADIILDEYIGRKSKRVERKLQPIPYWVNGLILSFFVLIIGLLGSLLDGGVSLFFTPIVIWSVLFGVGFGYSMLLGFRAEFQSLVSTLNNHVIDAINSTQDLRDLKKWLETSFDVKMQLRTSIILTLLLLIVEVTMLDEILVIAYPKISYLLISTIVFFQISWTSWGIIPNSILIYKLGSYSYEMYIVDPSSSSVVKGIASYLYGQLLIRGALAAVFTFGAAMFGFLNNQGMIIVVLVLWSILSIVFINGQQTLKRIIRKSKMETLEGIQKKIQEKTKDELSSKETMDAINRLADFHDRIRDGRNSALNFEASMRFLQSLLLPLVASLLGNIEQVLNILKGLLSLLP